MGQSGKVPADMFQQAMKQKASSVNPAFLLLATGGIFSPGLRKPVSIRNDPALTEIRRDDYRYRLWP